jgi:hypothetical protein
MGSIKNEWREEEKQQLIEFFPTMGAEYCSDIIGRSKRGCQEMAKRLKLKRIFKFQNEELLKSVVEDSKNYTEVVKKIGLSPRCSGNFQTLKKYIKIFNIDISHFTGGSFQIGNTPKNKVKIESILKVDSNFSRTSLKKKLYSEGLKEKRCEICGIDENWFNGSKIVHILDHINGDPFDNRIENLRIVCPNCNSTLETSCSGNKVKKIYDVENDEYKNAKIYKKCNCGKIILIGSKMCSKCNGEDKRKVDRPDLETILKDVKELGYVGAGKKYGITDNGLRKWIKQYQKQVV